MKGCGNPRRGSACSCLLSSRSGAPISPRPGTLLSANRRSRRRNAEGASLNQFFPGRLTVNAGDKVTFTSFGFHTVTYLGESRSQQFLGPAKGEVYEGIPTRPGSRSTSTAAEVRVQRRLRRGPFGPKADRGQAAASSGPIPARSPRKPVKVTYAFPKIGKFKLLCIHPPEDGDDGHREAEGRGGRDPRGWRRRPRRRWTRRGRRRMPSLH